MGTSTGAAAAIFSAGALDHRVQGYIPESPYQDLKIAAWNRTALYLPPALSHAVYLGLRLVGPLFPPHLDEISPLNAIGAIPADVPVLILAGDADRLARPAEAHALFRRVQTHGKLVVFPNAGHLNLPESAKQGQRLAMLMVVRFMSDREQPAVEHSDFDCRRETRETKSGSRLAGGVEGWDAVRNTP